MTCFPIKFVVGVVTIRRSYGFSVYSNVLPVPDGSLDKSEKYDVESYVGKDGKTIKITGPRACVECIFYNNECGDWSNGYNEICENGFSNKVPVEIFFEKKEGSNIMLTIFGVTVLLLCVQKQDKFNDLNFQDLLYKMSQSYDKCFYFPSSSGLPCMHVQRRIIDNAHKNLANSLGLPVLNFSNL